MRGRFVIFRIICYLLGAFIHYNIRSLDDSEAVQTYVMASNDDYIDYLLVSLNSLLENTDGKVHVIILSYGLNGKNISKVRRTFKLTYGHKQLSFHILSYNRGRTHIYTNDGEGIKGKSIYINAKMSFIKDITDELIPEYKNMPHFMWLDSDTLAVGNVSGIYKRCLNCPDVAIASSNLFFLRGDLKGHSQNVEQDWRFNYGGFGTNEKFTLTSHTPGIVSTSGGSSLELYNMAMEKQGKVWRSSGGVLFFNMPVFRELAKTHQSEYNAKLIDEEVWIDNLFVDSNYPILVLAPVCNYRPTMLAQAERIQKQVNEKKYPGEKEIENEISAFVSASPIIYHWDTIDKPKKKSKKERLPADKAWFTRKSELDKKLMTKVYEVRGNDISFLSELYPTILSPKEEELFTPITSGLAPIPED